MKQYNKIPTINNNKSNNIIPKTNKYVIKIKIPITNNIKTINKI